MEKKKRAYSVVKHKNVPLTGGRMTPIKRALLDIFSVSSKPLTPQELLKFLAQKRFKANKTTVYRQLDTLVTNRILHEVQFGDRVARYEPYHAGQHHHHLVCAYCGKVEDVSLPTDVEAQERNILKKHGFFVEKHSLEFFGKCKNCR